MKIEVKERGSKECYDEFLYIGSKYKTIRKDPQMKTHKLTSFLIGYVCFIVFCIVLVTVFYLQYNELIFIFFSGMLTVLLIYVLFYLRSVNKQIQTFMQATDDKTIDINEKCVEFTDAEKSVRMKWEDIYKIIINQYTICFFPQQPTQKFIAIHAKYKSDLIQCLQELDKSQFVVDNSDLYKK